MSQQESDLTAHIPSTTYSEFEPAFAGQQPSVPVGPDNPPWGVGGAVLTWVGSVVLLIIVQSAFTLGYIFYRHVNLISPDEVKTFLTEDKWAIFVQVIALLPTHILTLMLIWAVVTQFGRYPFWSIVGLDWGKGPRLGLSIALAVALLVVGGLIGYFAGQQQTSIDLMILRSPPARYAIAILATLTAPLVEELTYRGVIYPALARRMGIILAVITTTLLFAMVHVPQYWGSYAVITTVALLSLFLTVIRAYSGRLLPSIVIHTIFNGIQAIYIIFGPQIDQMMKNEPKAPAFVTHLLNLFR
jgi:membrane protease YdiL (CAAX protease family)